MEKQAWVTSVCSAVAENDVRYMCGVFWRGKEETEKLFKGLRACADGVFFQTCGSYIAVYPAYLVVLGPSKEVTRPPFWRQPSWNDR